MTNAKDGAMTATAADFDRLTWHDNAVYGLRLDLGDPARDDWRAELVLDIDHIVEWLRGENGACRFRVAPATLTFHHATDLRLSIDSGDTGCQASIHPWAIDRIDREPVADQKICLDRPYYRWRILMNWPAGGLIAFGASGFSQGLRAAPVLCDEQRLSLRA
jgi:hypothetical protein